MNTSSDLISRIIAMKSQESITSSNHNYFSKTTAVDESSRTAMAEWLFKIVDAVSLNRETVLISLSLLDRYLSSNKGKSMMVLQDRQEFQLAAIASFYLAVKVYEPVVMGIDTLSKLCRGFYQESAILAMEQDILFALEWRVLVHTPLDFVRCLLELLPSSSISSVSSESIVEQSRMHLEFAAYQFHFSNCKPFVMGAACLAASLNELNILSTFEIHQFLGQIATSCDGVDMNVDSVMDVQTRLVSRSTDTISVSSKSCSEEVSKPVLSRCNAYRLESSGEGSSPVCVAQTARQA
jgi:hypothetical protein